VVAWAMRLELSSQWTGVSGFGVLCQGHAARVELMMDWYTAMARGQPGAGGAKGRVRHGVPTLYSKCTCTHSLHPPRLPGTAS